MGLLRRRRMGLLRRRLEDLRRGDVRYFRDRRLGLREGMRTHLLPCGIFFTTDTMEDGSTRRVVQTNSSETLHLARPFLNEAQVIRSSGCVRCAVRDASAELRHEEYHEDER